MAQIAHALAVLFNWDLSDETTRKERASCNVHKEAKHKRREAVILKIEELHAAQLPASAFSNTAVRATVKVRDSGTVTVVVKVILSVALER